MGSSRCEGLVRVRERVVWREAPPPSEESMGGDQDAGLSEADTASARVRRTMRTVGRLRDDVWYFCVARAPAAALEWFTVDAGTESSDEEDALPASSTGAVRLGTTGVSRIEGVDGETVKLPGGDKDDDALTATVVDEEERKRLESCSFYVEDENSGVALLIEAESPDKRGEWLQFFSALLPSGLRKEGADGDADDGDGDGDGDDDGNDVVEVEDDHGQEDSPFAPEALTSFASTRSLARQGDTAVLDLGEDAFGLLSLTTSALSSLNLANGSGSETSARSTAGTTAAPGMFAFHRIDVAEQKDDEAAEGEKGDDADDSETGGTTDGDCAADPVAVDSERERRQVFSQSRVDASGGSEPASGSIAQHADSSRDRRHSLDAIPTLPAASQEVPSNACFACRGRFGRFFRLPKTCVSCHHRFCRLHCNQLTSLTSVESLSGAGAPAGSRARASTTGSAPVQKRVCMDCFVRQQLLTSLQEVAVYYASAVDEAGGISKLVRWKYFDQAPKLEIEAHIQARHLGPLALLSAMFKYRQQPFMFVVVLAQLVQNVESCVETIDFYWPQFLQWGFLYLPEASPSVRAFYLFFLAATARRSVHLAVKATWECIAAHWDAMSCGRFKRGNGIVVMLFFVTNVNFGEPRSVLPQLLFPQAPPHQREALEALLAQLYECTRRVYAVSQREAPFFMWLLARSEDELVASSHDVRKHLKAGGGFLDPFPSNYHAEAQLMLLERRLSLTHHLAETNQRLRNKPAQHIFSDEVQLVRFLVDLCTYLKESIPVPAQRKKQLPALLQEMLRGKHIRPEAALPLMGVSARRHRVVNVLTDEGTVFSTKARAPTLVFFETIASTLETGDGKRLVAHESGDILPISEREQRFQALVEAGADVEMEEGIGSDNASDSSLEPEQKEILNYLDGDVVGTYVADLIPASRTGSEVSGRTDHSSIAEDFNGLSLVLPAGCTPLGGKSSFSDNGNDSDGAGSGSGSGESEEEEDEANGSSGSGSGSGSVVSSANGTKCPFFGERFADMQERVRAQSSFARFDGWALLPVIAKSFDDMRQEVFVLQGLKIFQLIFRKHSLDLWLHYYSIVCAGKDCGLLEVITDAQSLDGLKKKGKKISGVGTSLPKIFELACGRDPVTGEHDPARVERARENFVSSMAAYSLFSYIFLVKDRHNGNIMLDTEGHVVHIDFGFVLGIAPGNSFSLETAPFKLTPEMVEVMGPDGFERYRHLMAQGLLALHLEAPQILTLVYLSSKDSCFPCFQGRSRERIIRRLKRRLCVDWSVEDVELTAASIIDKSNGHRGTRRYDWFQRLTNGILP